MKYFTSAFLASSAMALSTLAPATGIASGEVSDTPFGPFSDGSLKGWKERSFVGNTEYELIQDNGVPVLRGHTDKQASVFYTEQSVDISETPFVNWSWKIDNIYQDIDQKTRAGDDFPARLYVVYQIGLLPWDTLAINYVWASQIPVDESWHNPHTDKAVMVVVQSGETDIGKWSAHSRNVHEDFKQHYNVDVKELSGFAVMVDGDNSKNAATAWFGEISFTDTAIER